ncbi:carcinoembryonic antigen-related cell adhesion molecule 4 [Alligator mississippiensis]|uniref:Carcinoembryonic antigen-related cell adhesion molecule 19 n=1 Tax=Alligator mississippiensis TaxID=8496 RepID=A0A151M3T5_ALLMI|nr:carcinoembryonic antigen-related cell adhesion molecule 4 [Alligator mississippiensis]KYO19177.1 carcinoembryonic antigen-related cell adhesion molecule 19 [Alligator mississippiensis]
MGHQSASQEPSAWHGAWKKLVLTVSLLACCPQPTTTQKQEPQGLTPNPSVPVVGQDFILSLYPVPHDILSCRWYRGTSTSHPSNLILTYDSQNKAGPIHGPAYTGRESVGPDCSLKIHPFKATDGGAYALTLQTFNGLSEYKIEVSGFSLRIPFVIIIVVAVIFIVLLAVGLGLFFYLRGRRRQSASIVNKGPTGKYGATPPM